MTLVHGDPVRMPTPLDGIPIEVNPSFCALFGQYIQRRRHHRPRIDKKWRRFGTKLVTPCKGYTFQVLGRITMCPHKYDELRALFKGRVQQQPHQPGPATCWRIIDPKRAFT